MCVQLQQAPPSQPGSARSAVSARSLGGFSAVSGHTNFSSQAGAGHALRQQQPDYPPVVEEAAVGGAGPHGIAGADEMSLQLYIVAGFPWRLPIDRLQ